MKYLTLEQKNNIGILTITKEESLNTINSNVLDEFSSILDTIESSPIKVLIFTGKGRAFCAGAEIKEMCSFTQEDALRFSKKGNDLFLRIERLTLPTIAAINGYALGGGLELALSCDICLASTQASFGLPETTLGVIPGFGGTKRLAQAIGMNQAKEMIYTGSRIDAPHALDLKLVNHIYSSEDLMDKAIEMAMQIAKNGSYALAMAKKAISHRYWKELQEDVLIEETLFSKCFTTTDQKERMRSFLTKNR